MKNRKLILGLALIPGIMFLSNCQQASHEEKADDQSSMNKYNGYQSQEAWGEHLVASMGCNDCHTPKKMTDHGPDLDSSLLLSGHPAQMPIPDIDRKMVEKKGLAVTDMLTAWVGPWGVSFAANLTSDPTGIGNWQEENFIRAIREGKYKGIESARSLMPPMPWPMYKHLTDDELKAIFAFLKSTNPVSNLVPQVMPPLSAPQGM